MFSIWRKRENKRKYHKKFSTQVLLTSSAEEGIKKFDMNQRIIAEQHLSQSSPREFMEKSEISKLNSDSLAPRIPDVVEVPPVRCAYVRKVEAELNGRLGQAQHVGQPKCWSLQQAQNDCGGSFQIRMHQLMWWDSNTNNLGNDFLILQLAE